MNACDGYKMDLSLLATGGLHEKEALRVRAHMESCPGCKGYFGQISSLAAELKSAGALVPEVEVPPRFHGELMRRINSEVPPGLLADLFAILRQRLLRWRFATPALVTFVLMALLFWVARGNRTAPSSRRIPAISTAAQLAPTFGAYHNLAENSWDALDRELTREAADAPTAPGVLTAASISPALFAE